MTAQAIEALQLIHQDLKTLLDDMDDADWSLPSACDGWRVQDVFAHVSSNMKETVEPTPPPEDPPPAMKAEEAMEALVAPRRDWTSLELLAEYDQYYEGWLGAMSAMQEEPTASTVAPLADLGEHPLHLVANAYAFDHYCHLRIDLLDPSGPLTANLPAPTDAMVRPGIEWMLAGMPQMQPDELPPILTQPLRLVLTGPGGGTWTVTPGTEDGLFSVDETSAGDVAATVTSSAHDFVSWGTKRSDWRAACTIEGDQNYAEQVLEVINII
jgi:uncharacterized protein (TIGR03083 family)